MPKYAQPELRAAFFEKPGPAGSDSPRRTVGGNVFHSTVDVHHVLSVLVSKVKPTRTKCPQAWFSSVSPNYFEVMHIAPLAGGHLPIMIALNSEGRGHKRHLRHRFFPGEDPIGKRLVISFLNTPLTRRDHWSRE